MKDNTVKITFCGVLSALATALMLLSYFPYFTYVVPAVSGVVMLVVLIELGHKWAWATYAVTAVLSFVFAEPEAKLMFVLFLGFYPIIKAYIEKLRSRALQYLIKFAVFNTSVFAVYVLLANAFGIYLGDVIGRGAVFIALLLVLANVTFYLYDIVLVRTANFYIFRLHVRISGILRIKK